MPGSSSEGNRRNRHERRGSQQSHAKSRSGNKGRPQRGGAGRNYDRNNNPQRIGYREERITKRINEPDLPGDIDIADLDPMVLQDLKVLSRGNAEAVAKHLIMAATLLEEDPARALEHARAAKDRAGRVAVTRETNGIVAYRAGEWKEALAELRAARRMSGGPGLLAVMADAERGLGRPLKAIELGRSEEAEQLDPESRIELGIVVAGARHDLGQHDSALATLQALGPSFSSNGAAQARLSYALGDALEILGRTKEAIDWFSHAAEIDEWEMLDAKERLAILTGEAETKIESTED